MENLTLNGTFINQSNNVQITFYTDTKFEISGFGGLDPFSGEYWFEESKVAGFPYYLTLRRNDINTFGIDRAFFNLLNDSAFQILDNKYSQFGKSPNVEITTYTKLL